MQGVMISDLRQEEHLVRLEAKEVRRVIEVGVGVPGVHAIAVFEAAFETGHDLGLRILRGSRGGGRLTLRVGTQDVGYIGHVIQELGKRANVLRWPVAVLGLWHRVRRLHDLVLHIAAKNG